MDALFRVMVVAQQGLTEAMYSRTYLLLSIVIIVSASIGMFAGELVLSGTEDTRLVVYNFTLRLSLVSIIAIYTIQSLIREKADKQTD